MGLTCVELFCLPTTDKKRLYVTYSSLNNLFLDSFFYLVGLCAGND